MLNYLKRRFSSTELINEIKSGVGYGVQQSQHQTGSSQRPVQDHKYLPEEVRKQTVEEMYMQGATDGGQIRGARMTFPSAPNSPTKQASMISSSGAGGGGGGGGSGGFMNTVTGQLSKAKNLFSTETLNSIIADVKVPGTTSGSKCKILLVIDHPLTDWAKYMHKRKIDGEWEVRVEQAQMNDISITAYPDQGCVVTVQDGRGARTSARTFKPDFVLIRQGLGVATQHYENLITGLMFGAVPCMNSVEALYHMRNKAWVFSNLLKIQKRLGATEFPLIARNFQAKNLPQNPGFQYPVNVRIGGDSARECEVRVEDTTLFQSLMALANNTQRYATIEPCIPSVCEVIIQKIGSFTKAFMRKPISNPVPGSSVPTVLEKIPVSPKFNLWITEVAQMFGGLDMCALKALQDSAGNYFIQDVYGSEFILLGDGQEEDRGRIAELLLQRMERTHKAAIGIPRTISQSQVSQASTRTTTASSASPPVQVVATSQSGFTPTTPVQEQPGKSTFGGQQRQQSTQSSSFSMQEQQRPLKPQPPAPPQPTPPPTGGRQTVSSGVMDFGSTRPSLQSQRNAQTTFDSSSRSERFSSSTMRNTSMDFPNYTQSTRTNYGKESDEGVGMPVSTTLASTSTSSTVTRSHLEDKTPDPWASGQTIRDSSLDESGSFGGHPQKEAIPHPSSQSSLGNSFEARAFDSYASSTGSSTSATSTNIFDPSINIFQTQNKSPMSTFQTQSVESDTSRSMKFDTPSMDFGQSSLEIQHKDPWSVPPVQTSQTPSTRVPPFTTSSSFSSTPGVTTSVAGRPRQPSQQSIGNPDDADDTMKNLRKTFAGIFGDI